MIRDIMSESFATFSSKDEVGRLLKFIGKGQDTEFIAVSSSGAGVSLMELSAAKEVLRKIGEKVGSELAKLPLESIPEFSQFCDSVGIDESEQIARSKARRSPDRQIVVLKGDKVVGVIKEHVRGFGGVPTTLYGERYDIFEKGAVKPKHQLTCPACKSTFDFCEPVIEDGKITAYRCPVCKEEASSWDS